MPHPFLLLVTCWSAGVHASPASETPQSAGAIDFAEWDQEDYPAEAEARRVLCLKCQVIWKPGMAWGSWNGKVAQGNACWDDRCVHKYWFGDVPLQVPSASFLSPDLAKATPTSDIAHLLSVDFCKRVAKYIECNSRCSTLAWARLRKALLRSPVGQVHFNKFLTEPDYKKEVRVFEVPLRTLTQNGVVDPHEIDLDVPMEGSPWNVFMSDRAQASGDGVQYSESLIIFPGVSERPAPSAHRKLV